MFKLFPSSVLNSLSSLELEILRYIDNHKNEICDMPIQVLAKNTFVSTTTIIRLCRKLNLEGFSHLKFFIKNNALKNAEDSLPVKAFSVQNTIAEELSDIERTSALLDEAVIENVADIMAKSSQMHFFAKGLTELALEYTARHLLSLSKHVTLYQDTHIAYIQSKNLSDKDIIFLASLSGETEQVVRVAQIARSRNATVITFSVNPTSSLAKLGNYNFQLINDAETTLDVDTKSRCQLMFILNILVKAFIHKSNKVITEKHNTHQ